MATSSPTARRYQLAGRLKQLRMAAGKTPQEVATELECSTAKVSRMETGQRPVQGLDIKVLCRFYEVSPEIQAELMALATEARRPGWWQDFGTLDEQTQTFVGLESAAEAQIQLEVVRIPGLLQTSDYTRTWVERMRPPGFWQPGDLDQIVTVRLRRQQRVASGELQLSAVIDEAAFARRLTPLNLMADQAEHLLAVAEWPNVHLQVVPFDAGPHPGLDGSFQLLDFPAGGLHSTVFVEAQYGNLVIDKRDIVSRYRDVYQDVSETVALTTEDTKAWLHRYLERRGEDPGGLPSRPGPPIRDHAEPSPSLTRQKVRRRHRC